MPFKCEDDMAGSPPLHAESRMDDVDTARRNSITLRIIVAVFVGLTITIVQVALSGFLSSQWLNWALPGFLIFDGLYYHLPAIPLLMLAILANIVTFAIAVFLLLLIVGRWTHRGPQGNQGNPGKPGDIVPRFP